MLHTSTLLRRLAWRDTPVLLSRTPFPWFVLQDRLCSVHAAGALPLGWRRLCAFKVKLPMTWAREAGLLVKPWVPTVCTVSLPAAQRRRDENPRERLRALAP